LKTRPYAKPQQSLRGFFGLGPDQFESIDGISPTLDVDFLQRSQQDVTTVFGSTAAAAPGAQQLVSLSPPSDGVFLLDSVHMRSLGPATSGNFRMYAYVSRNVNLWAIASDIGLQENVATHARVPSFALRVGFFLKTPLILVRRSAAVSDNLVAVVSNEGGSVGNVQADVSWQLRQIDGPVSS